MWRMPNGPPGRGRLPASGGLCSATAIRRTSWAARCFSPAKTRASSREKSCRSTAAAPTTNSWIAACSLGLDVCALDDLTPALDFLGDEGARLLHGQRLSRLHPRLEEHLAHVGQRYHRPDRIAQPC